MGKLGLGASTALVAGNMIGSGIFLLPAGLAVYGKLGLVGWCCASVGALLLASVFRQLGVIQPDAPGGPYAYVRRAFGDLPGFAVAWGYWVSIWCTNAAIAVACVGYLGVFFPVLASNALASAMSGVGLIVIFTAINSAEIRKVAAVQSLTTVLKVLPLLALGILGLAHLNLEHLWHEGTYKGGVLSGITSATTFTLFAFLGVESAAISSARIRHPARNMGRASLLGTLLTVLVYLLGTLAVMGVVPPEVLMESEAPFADAAGTLWGSQARTVMAAAAVVATLGALNGWLFIQGEFPMAVADDGLFPAVFAKRNRMGIPFVGIAVSSALACAVLLFRFSDSLVDTFTFMMTLSTLSALLPYLLSALALRHFLHGRTGGAKGRWLGAVTVVFCVWVIFGCGGEVLLYGGILLGVGLCLHAARTAIRNRL
jgi:APA family basic amino acid/polyamine antiporter